MKKKKTISQPTISRRPWVPWLSVLVLCAVRNPSCGAAVGPVAGGKADLVLTSTHIVTMDSARQTAAALAVQGDRIVAVGSEQEIEPWIGASTRVLRLPGKTVVPGFIDAHGHFMGLGQSKMMLDLTAARTWNMVVQQVAAAVRTAPAGKWIVGRGWHQILYAIVGGRIAYDAAQ